MGIFEAISNSISSTLSDQFLEAIVPSSFDEHSAVVPGIVKNSTNNNGTAGIISNGSIIYVPENTASFIFDKDGIESIITQSGGYKYQDGELSFFNGDGITNSFFKQALKRVGFAGESPEGKKIAYVNLREIRNIKFGTRGSLIYNDLFYGVDLEVVGFGSFSIKINDAEKFIRNFVPAGISSYSFDDENVKSQMISELLQSFSVALNSLSDKYRISQLLSQSNEISNTIKKDEKNVGSWNKRFGFELTNVSLENIEFTDDSRELVRQYSENKMNIKAYEDISQKASNIAAQQKIAEGIKNNGLGETGNMIFAMNMAQSLNQNVAPTSNNSSFDQQVENLKKLKELLDSGILTEEEFNKKKKEILGL